MLFLTEKRHITDRALSGEMKRACENIISGCEYQESLIKHFMLLLDYRLDLHFSPHLIRDNICEKCIKLIEQTYL